jgi:hypothetical protein
MANSTFMTAKTHFSSLQTDHTNIIRHNRG